MKAMTYQSVALSDHDLPRPRQNLHLLALTRIPQTAKFASRNMRDAESALRLLPSLQPLLWQACRRRPCSPAAGFD